jgi:hypothetical protein
MGAASTDADTKGWMVSMLASSAHTAYACCVQVAILELGAWLGVLMTGRCIP